MLEENQRGVIPHGLGIEFVKGPDRRSVRPGCYLSKEKDRDVGTLTRVHQANLLALVERRRDLRRVL
jgi:hypothetical protein